MKILDKTVALEIEAKIVEALNDGFPDSSADQQAWDDKAEAAGNELRKRYPDESEAQVDAWLDEFCQDYCARPLPYAKAADDKMRGAALDMLEALKAAEEIIKTARQYFPKSIKNRHTYWLENTNAAIGKAIHKATGGKEG